MISPPVSLERKIRLAAWKLQRLEPTWDRMKCLLVVRKSPPQKINQLLIKLSGKLGRQTQQKRIAGLL